MRTGSVIRFSISLLTKGVPLEDVSILLGHSDTRVTWKHYAPFVKELRDRARRIMENGEGLEKTSDTIWAQSPGAPRRLQ